jgi:hypothetical protein
MEPDCEPEWQSSLFAYARKLLRLCKYLPGADLAKTNDAFEHDKLGWITFSRSRAYDDVHTLKAYNNSLYIFITEKTVRIRMGSLKTSDYLPEFEYSRRFEFEQCTAPKHRTSFKVYADQSDNPSICYTDEIGKDCVYLVPQSIGNADTRREFRDAIMKIRRRDSDNPSTSAHILNIQELEEACSEIGIPSYVDYAAYCRHANTVLQYITNYTMDNHFAIPIANRWASAMSGKYRVAADGSILRESREVRWWDDNNDDHSDIKWDNPFDDSDGADDGVSIWSITVDELRLHQLTMGYVKYLVREHGGALALAAAGDDLEISSPHSKGLFTITNITVVSDHREFERFITKHKWKKTNEYIPENKKLVIISLSAHA